jgi:hypothetical protein
MRVYPVSFLFLSYLSYLLFNIMLESVGLHNYCDISYDQKINADRESGTSGLVQSVTNDYKNRMLE